MYAEYASAQVTSAPVQVEPIFEPVPAHSFEQVAPVNTEQFSFAGSQSDSLGTSVQPNGTPAVGLSALEEFALLTNQDPTNAWDDDEPIKNSAATAGLTWGVLSLFIPAIPAILGLIFGFIGLSKARSLSALGEEPVGRGKSIAALILSGLGIVAVALAAIFVLPGILGTTETSGAQEEVIADDPLNDLGNVVLEVGTFAQLTSIETQETAVEFAVTQINQDFTCAADPNAVASGRFISVTMEFTTATDYLDVMESNQPLSVSGLDWTGYTFDGTAVALSTNGASCLSAEEALPATIPAGETVTGTLVLDISTDVTALSWAPTTATGITEESTRWEWQFV